MNRNNDLIEQVKLEVLRAKADNNYGLALILQRELERLEFRYNKKI